MANYICLNGVIQRDSDVSISPENRSFRYGDGCFETMRMIGGQVLLQDLHMNRLLASLDQLQFNVPSYFTPGYLLQNISELIKVNQLTNCRIRITIFRGNGSLHDFKDLTPGFIIQVYALQKPYNTINDDGLKVSIYPDAVKSADNFSSIKCNSFLAYAMAAIWAGKHDLNDAFLLNQFGRLADSTIANIFIIKDGTIKTPSLSEGCIAGVMRRHLLTEFKKANLPIYEEPIEVEDVLNASEIFLTNAIRGIQWVKQVDKSNYTNHLTQALYNQFIHPLFNL